MIEPSPTPPPRPKHSAYVTAHCRTCAAGWTRTLEKGEAVIVCLLDREAALAGMTHCDRYEARPPEVAPPAPTTSAPATN